MLVLLVVIVLVSVVLLVQLLLRVLVVIVVVVVVVVVGIVVVGIYHWLHYVGPAPLSRGSAICDGYLGSRGIVNVLV